MDFQSIHSHSYIDSVPFTQAHSAASLQLHSFSESVILSKPLVSQSVLFTHFHSYQVINSVEISETNKVHRIAVHYLVNTVHPPPQ